MQIKQDWFDYDPKSMTTYNEPDRQCQEQTDDDMKVEQTEQTNTDFRSTLSNESEQRLAEQLALMNFALLKQIGARELIDQGWKQKAHSAAASPNVLSLIRHFNEMTNWIQMCIFTAPSLKKRVKVLLWFINVGKHLREMQDLLALCAIYSALNAAEIGRLKAMWKKIAERKENQEYKSWAALFKSPFTNLRNLLQSADGACVPHIGLMLQDIVLLDEKVAEYRKFLQIAMCIKWLQSYQQNAYDGLVAVPQIQETLLSEFGQVAPLTEDELWDISTTVKKADLNQ